MKKLLAMMCICFALCACRIARLTPEGRDVMVVTNLNSLTTECERMGSVVGQHKLGYDSALIIARNKAAALKADTIVINSIEGRASPSRRITASALNCKDRRAQPIQIVNPDVPGATQDTFDKAKKCQAKGGVWINDQCVVSVQ